MRKKSFWKQALRILALVTVALVLVGTQAGAYQAEFGPTELIKYDPTKTYDGYTLWYTGGIASLIDMQGNLINKWSNRGDPWLLRNGNLMSGLSEYDWDGNVVRALTAPSRPNKTSTKSTLKIFNKKINDWTVLFLANHKITTAEALANGMNQVVPPGAETSNTGNYSVDSITEIDMKGNIIWEWSLWDHIIQNYDATKLNYGDPTAKENWGRLNLNLVTNGRMGFAPDWTHVNAMDYNYTLDQIAIDSRELSEIYVINHSLTTAEAATRKGDFVWRWGNPANYGQGNAPTFHTCGHEQLFGPHDIQWIGPAGARSREQFGEKAILPGAGNLLIFENGSNRPAEPAVSQVFEINPYSGPMENGVYVWEKDAGYTPSQHNMQMPPNQSFDSKQIVWHYDPRHAYFNNAHGMYSAHISSAQRLPNGNTLIDAGELGNFAEVTPDGTVVWNYISPVLLTGEVVKQIGPKDCPNVFRVYRYGPDHPAFIGKLMLPRGPITAPITYTGFGFGGGGVEGGGGVGGPGGVGGGY